MRLHDLEVLIQRCVGHEVAKHIQVSTDGIVTIPREFQKVTQDLYRLIKKYFSTATLTSKGNFSEINIQEDLPLYARLNAKYRLTFKE